VRKHKSKQQNGFKTKPGQLGAPCRQGWRRLVNTSHPALIPDFGFWLERATTIPKRNGINRAIVPSWSGRNIMTKSYAPPLTANPHDPLYRVDKAIKAAQQRLDAAIDAKRYHTSQNLAHEVIKEAREGLKKSEQLRVLKLKELAQKAG
jgi:hypothetical protein